MKKLLVFCSTLVVMIASQVNIATAGCIETEVTQYQVDITPQLDCLHVEMSGNDCDDYVNLAIDNLCDESVMLRQVSPECDSWYSDGEICENPQEFPPQTEITSNPANELLYEAENGELHFEGTHGGDPFDLEISYEARVVESSAYDGCGCSATSDNFLAPAVPLALLGFAGVVVVGLRRRDR